MEDFGYLKEERSHFSGWLRKATLLGATLFSIFCFIYITISAYNFVYEDEAPIETIKSPAKPIKVTAKNKVITNSKDKNSAIYDEIFGHKEEPLAKIIPKVYLAPEPVKPPKQAKIKTYKNQKSPAKTKKKPKKRAKRKTTDTRIVIYTDNTKEKKVNDLLTKANAASKTKKKAPSRGRVKVQIAALTSEKSVNNYWRKLNRVSPKLFSGLKLFTKKVDLGKRGIFYRVQIGNFHDQIEAEAFCEKYVAQASKSRADCIVVE